MTSVLRGHEQGASPIEDAGNIVRGRWGERMEAEQAVHQANRNLYPDLYAVTVKELQRASHDTAIEDLRAVMGNRDMVTPQAAPDSQMPAQSAAYAGVSSVENSRTASVEELREMSRDAASKDLRSMAEGGQTDSSLSVTEQQSSLQSAVYTGVSSRENGQADLSKDTPGLDQAAIMREIDAIHGPASNN